MLYVKVHLLKDAECTIVVEGTPLAILASGLLNGQVVAAVDPSELGLAGESNIKVFPSLQVCIHASYPDGNLLFTE
jgi:hypothetical protein